MSEKSVLKKDTEEKGQIMENIDDWSIAEEIADMKGNKPSMENFAALVQASIKGSCR